MAFLDDRGVQPVANTVPLRQAQEGGEFLFRGVGIERELQAYVLETNGDILGQTQGSAEIEITFG